MTNDFGSFCPTKASNLTDYFHPLFGYTKAELNGCLWEKETDKYATKGRVEPCTIIIWQRTRIIAMI